MLNKYIYIGLVKVLPKPENKDFKEAKGVYVNVLTIANDSEEYELKVKEAMTYYGFICEEMEDVEKLSDRLENNEVSEDILELAKEIKSESDVRYGQFFIWE